MISKLLLNIPSTFDTNPEIFLGFRLFHTSALFKWEVVNNKLNGYDGSEALFSINLSGLTFADLFARLNNIPGVSFTDPTANLEYSSGNIIPSRGDQLLLTLRDSLQSIAKFLLDLGGSNASNPAYDLLMNAMASIARVTVLESEMGGIYADGHLLRKLLDPIATELGLARTAVTEALGQMTITTADADWLDGWGVFMSVPRISGEPDDVYCRRIIVEVLRPRSNNIAMEVAIKEAFGQDIKIRDVAAWDNVVWYLDGSVTLNGSHTLSQAAVVRYGLFDAVVGYDLENGASQSEFSAVIRAFLNRFRAAGTQLRTLQLGGVSLADDVFVPYDAAMMSVYTAIFIDGSRRLDGSWMLTGGKSVTETLS